MNSNMTQGTAALPSSLEKIRGSRAPEMQDENEEEKAEALFVELGNYARRQRRLMNAVSFARIATLHANRALESRFQEVTPRCIPAWMLRESSGRSLSSSLSGEETEEAVNGTDDIATSKKGKQRIPEPTLDAEGAEKEKAETATEQETAGKTAIEETPCIRVRFDAPRTSSDDAAPSLNSASDGKGGKIDYDSEKDSLKKASETADDFGWHVVIPSFCSRTYDPAGNRTSSGSNTFASRKCEEALQHFDPVYWFSLAPPSELVAAQQAWQVAIQAAAELSGVQIRLCRAADEFKKMRRKEKF